MMIQQSQVIDVLIVTLSISRNVLYLDMCCHLLGIIYSNRQFPSPTIRFCRSYANEPSRLRIRFSTGEATPTNSKELKWRWVVVNMLVGTFIRKG
jgi:hypothetical protein